MKKKFSLLFALIYLQVNVAWAGLPTQNPFSIFNFQFSKLKKKKVLVFHRNPQDQAWDWMRNQPQPPTRTPLDRLEDNQPEIRPGRPESNRNVETPRTQSQQTVDNLISRNQGKTMIEAADNVAHFAIQNLPIEKIDQGDLAGSALKSLVQNIDANGPTTSQRMELGELNKTFALAGFKVDIVKAEGTYKLQIQKVEPPNLTRLTPEQMILAQVSNPGNPNVREVRGGPVGNWAIAVRQSGVGGAISDIDRRTVIVENGSKMVRTPDGDHFVGKLSFMTNNGIKITVEGTAQGKVTIHKEATRNAEFIEVGKNNKPIARTFFKAGDTETRVNGKLTHFEAKAGAITREILVKPAKGAPGQQNQNIKPGELKGSVGEYVVREGNTDSTFKMQNNKVTLMEMKNNISGDTLAKRGNDGQMHATALGQQAGMEKTFKVLDGPHFDEKTGQAQLNIVFGATGETRELVVPKTGKDGGGTAGAPDHIYKNVDVQLMGEDNKGTRFQITGRQDAQMAATLSLNGETRLSQRVVGENIVYRDQAGKNVIETLDNVTVELLDDNGNVISSMHPTAVTSHQKEFARIGVTHTMPIEFPNGAKLSGTIQIKNNQVVSADIKAQMPTGASAQLSIKDGQRQWTYSTVNANNPTTYEMGDNKISVPQGREIISLNGVLQPDKNNSFKALGGVSVQMGANSFTYQFNQNTNQLTVANVNVQSVQIAGVNLRLNSDPATIRLAGSQVFFEVKNGGTKLWGQAIRDSGGNEHRVDGTVKYAAMSLDGRVTGSMQVDVKAPMALPDGQKGGPGGSGLLTPGAISQNLIYDKATNTISPIAGVPSTVAVAVVDSGAKGADGKPILDAQFNIFALGSKNIVAGNSGMDFQGTNYSAGMSIDIEMDATLSIRGGANGGVMTTPDGSTYQFDANTNGRLNAEQGLTVQQGRVVHTEPKELKNLQEGLKADVKTQQETEITPAGSKVTRPGEVVWTTSGSVEIELPKGARLKLDAGLNLTTSTKELVSAILADQMKFNNDKGITIKDVDQVEQRDGLKITVHAAQVLRIDRSGKHVDQKGNVSFEVTSPNGFNAIDAKTGAGWTASAGAKFTAHNLSLSGLAVKEGQVTLRGVKAGTTNELAKGVVREVIKQGLAIYEAGKKPSIQKEEFVIKGQQNASLDLGGGRALVFNEASVLVQEGNGFRFHESSAVGSKFSLVSEQKGINGDFYKHSSVRNVVSQEKISADKFKISNLVEHKDDSGVLRQSVLSEDTRAFNKPLESITATRTTQSFDETGQQRSNTVVTVSGDTETRSITVMNKQGVVILEAQQTTKDGKTEGTAKIRGENGLEATTSDRMNFGHEVLKAMNSAENTFRIGGVEYKATVGNVISRQILDGQMKINADENKVKEWREDPITLVTASGETATGTASNIRKENSAVVFDLNFSAPSASEGGEVVSTGVRFTDGMVSHRLGDMVAKDGTKYAFSQGSDGFKFVSKEDFSFDLSVGRVTQSVDDEGRAHVQTHFAVEHVGKSALGVTDQGFERGIVAYLPMGSGRVNIGGSNTTISIGEKSIGLQRVDESNQLTNQFLVTSDVARREGKDDYFIEAGTLLAKNDKGELTKILSGSIRVEQGGGKEIGKNNQVNALSGGAGGASADKPERVLFDEDESKNMIMKQGRAYIWTDGKTGEAKMGFKPGTVFVHQGKQYQAFVQSKHSSKLNLVRNELAYKQFSVLTADDNGKMVLKHAVKTDAKKGEDIAKDLRDRGRFWEVKETETEKEEGKEKYSLVVLDSDYRIIGTYSLSDLKPIQEVRSTMHSDVWVDTDRRALGQGVFVANGSTPVKDKNGYFTSKTLVYGEDGVTTIKTNYYADMTPVQQFTIDPTGKTVQVGVYEKLSNGKLGWSDQEKKTPYDPVVALPLFGLWDVGIRIKESNLGHFAGSVAAVGAVLLAPFTGGTSLIALSAAGTFGYMGASASIGAFKEGNDWMGAFYMATAFLPAGLGALQSMKVAIKQVGVLRSLLVISKTSTLGQASWRAFSAAELFTSGAQLAGRYLELSFAFDVAHSGTDAFNSYSKTGWSEKTRGAVGETMWNIALFSVGRIAKGVGYLTQGTGKTARFFQATTGFGSQTAKGWGGRAWQLTRQTGTLAVMGGVGFAGWHAVVGDGFKLSNVGVGALTGAGALLAHKALSFIPTKMAQWLGVKIETGVAAVKAETKMQALGNYAKEATVGASRMLQDMGAGAITSVGYNTISNLSQGKKWDENIGFAINRGTFFGFFGGGALRAVSNWGKAFSAMNGELKKTYAFGLVQLRGIDAFNWERIVGGFTMGVWEVAFNSITYDGSVMSAMNPLTWSSGITAMWGGHEEATGEQKLTTLGHVFQDVENSVLKVDGPLAFLRPAFEKFSSTFVNISALHPFFSLGRPGKNPVVDGVGALSDSLVQKGRMLIQEASLTSKVLGRSAIIAGTLGQKAVVMPLTIKTFGIFEGGAEYIAVEIGVLPPNSTTEQQRAGRAAVRLIGFMSAPIHPMHQSNEERVIHQELEGADVGFFGNLPGMGKLREARQKEAEARAKELNSSPGASFAFDFNGKRYAVEPNGTKNLRDKADAIVGRNAELNPVLAVDLNTDNGVAVQRSGGKSSVVDMVAKVQGEKMTAQEAAEIVFEQQAGVPPPEARAKEQIDAARDRLGMKDGDTLVRVTKEVRASSHRTYVNTTAKTKEDLRVLKNRAADGLLAPGVGDVAVFRLAGQAGMTRWVGARAVGITGNLLKSLGDITIRERLFGIKSTVQGTLKDLTPESRGKLAEHLNFDDGAPVTFMLGRGPLGFVVKNIKATAPGRVGAWMQGSFPTGFVDIQVNMTQKDGVSNFSVRGSNVKNGPEVLVDVVNKQTHIINSRVADARALFNGNSADETLLQQYLGQAKDNDTVGIISLKTESGEITEAKIKNDKDNFSFGELKADIEGKNITVKTKTSSPNFTTAEQVANGIKGQFDSVMEQVANPNDRSLQREFAIDHMAQAARAKYSTPAEMRAFIDRLKDAITRVKDKDFEAEILITDLKAALEGKKTFHSEAAWVQAKRNFHQVRSDLISEGKNRSQVLKEERFKNAQDGMIKASGYDGRLKDLRSEVNQHLQAVAGNRRGIDADVRGWVKGLDRIVKKLEKELKKGDLPAGEALAELEFYSKQLTLSLGAEKVDKRRIAELRADIRALKATGKASDAMAADILDSIVNASEDLVANPGNKDTALTKIDTNLSALRQVYDLHKGGVNVTGVIDRLLGAPGHTKISTEQAIHEIFGKDKLNVAERMAFVVATAERYLQVIDGKGPNASLKNEQASLFLQFSVGRVAGLQAGGGKTLVFIMGLADHVLRQKAAGKTAQDMTGELVVFAEHEVEKYVSETQYQRLFEALGMEAVDGTRLAGEDSKTRERAVKAYTPDGTRVKIVVSDLHSRGFLERQLRAEPESELAKLVRERVDVLGLDEVDASLLSRLSFISSDGNLVANADQRGRVESITDAVIEILMEGRQSIDLNKRDSYAYDPAMNLAGYRDLKGGEAKTMSDRGKWYAENEGDIQISDAFMAAVRQRVGDKVTTNEIKQVLRALDAVGNENAFGFARGEKNDERSLRPTHKRSGHYQHGQIDSSVTFNIAAVIFERAAREAKGETKAQIDAVLPLNDIKLSDAGSMATFVQVLQRGIHRFGATGTPEAIKGLAERVIGLKVVDVDPSSYNDYKNTRMVSSVDASYNTARSNDKTLNYLDKQASGQSTAQIGARSIERSLGEGAGILIGSPREAELREALFGYMEHLGADAKTIRELRSAGLSIRKTVEAAKLKAQESGKKALIDALEKVKVIDGNENAQVVEDTIVKMAGEKQLVVFATEVGLRALSYDVVKNGVQRYQVDLLLFGTEKFSTESNLQAFARVDRGIAVGARRLIVLDRTILENRVAVAKKVDEHLREKFNRLDGLFKNKPLKNINEKNMSLKELVELAGDFASLEGRSQSALFFIGEQVKSKLIQEPLQDMIAHAKTPAEKAYLEEKLVELLKHSDEFDIGKQGVEYRDPIDIVSDAFRSGTNIALKVLTEIGGHSVVSKGTRLQAAMRISDILSARRSFESKIRRPSDRGTFGDLKEFEDAAFTNVSGNVRNNPAQMVADVVITLTDYVLPGTQPGRAPPGPRGGPQRLAEATVHASRGQPGSGSHQQDLNFANASMNPPSGPTTRLSSYREQAIASVTSGLTSMNKKDQKAALDALSAAGMIDQASTNDVAQAAVSMVSNWNQAGGRDDQFDFETILNAANDLTTLSNGAPVSAGDVLHVTLSAPGNYQEALAEVLQNNAGPMGEAAKTVAGNINKDRQDAMGLLSSHGLAAGFNYVRVAFHAVQKWLNNPAKTKLSEAGKDPRAMTALAMMTGTFHKDLSPSTARAAVKGLIASLMALQGNRDFFSKLSVKDLVAALGKPDGLSTLVKTAEVSAVKKYLGWGATALNSAGVAAFTLKFFGILSATTVTTPVLAVLFGGALIFKVLSYDSNVPSKPNVLLDTVKKGWDSYKQWFKSSPVRTTMYSIAAIPFMGYFGAGLVGWGIASTVVNIVGNVAGKYTERYVNAALKVGFSPALRAVRLLEDLNKAKEKDKPLTLGDIVKAVNADKNIKEEDREDVIYSALILAGVSPERAEEIMSFYNTKGFDTLFDWEIEELQEGKQRRADDGEAETKQEEAPQPKPTRPSAPEAVVVDDEQEQEEFLADIQIYESSLRNEPITVRGLVDFFTQRSKSHQIDKAVAHYVGRAVTDDELDRIFQLAEVYDAFLGELSKLPRSQNQTGQNQNSIARLDAALRDPQGYGVIFHETFKEHVGKSSPYYHAFDMLPVGGALVIKVTRAGVSVGAYQLGLPARPIAMMMPDPDQPAIIQMALYDFQAKPSTVGTVEITIAGTGSKTYVSSIRMDVSENTQNSAYVFSNNRLRPVVEGPDGHIVYVASAAGKTKSTAGATVMTFVDKYHASPVGAPLFLPNHKGSRLVSSYVAKKTQEAPNAAAPEQAAAQSAQPFAEDMPVDAQPAQTVDVDNVAPEAKPASAAPVLSSAWVEALPEKMSTRMKQFFATHRSKAEAGTVVEIAVFSVKGQPEVIWGRWEVEGTKTPWLAIASRTLAPQSIKHGPSYFVKSKAGDVQTYQWKPASEKSDRSSRTAASSRRGIGELGLLAAVVAIAVPVVGLLNMAVAAGPAAIAPVIAGLAPVAAAVALPIVAYMVVRAVVNQEKKPIVMTQKDFDDKINSGNEAKKYVKQGDIYFSEDVFAGYDHSREQGQIHVVDTYSVEGKFHQVVEPGVPMRDNVFVTQIDVLSEPATEMIAYFPRTEVHPAQGIDRAAIDGVQAIRSHWRYGAVANALSVQYVLTDTELETMNAIPALRSDLAKPQPVSLGDIGVGEYSSQYEDYLFQLLAYNNNALAGSGSFVVQVEALDKFADQDTLFVQTNPGRRPASFSSTDHGASIMFTDLNRDHHVAFAQSSEEPGTFTMYVAGELQVINKNGKREQGPLVQNNQRSRVPYFEALVSPALEAIRDFIDRFETPVDPGLLAVAQDTVGIAHDLHTKFDLSDQQIKDAWYVVGQYASNKSNATVEELMRGTSLAGLGIAQVLQQLADQTRVLWAADPAVGRIQQMNAMPALGIRTNHRFLDVAGMPKESVLPWLAAEMLNDIKSIPMMTAAEARKSRVENVSMENVRASLLSYAALAQVEGYSGVIAANIINDNETDYDLQVGLLRAIARGFARSSRGYVRDENYEISIMNKEKFQQTFFVGKAHIDGREITIQKEESFVKMAIALLHELGHPYVDRVLENYPGGESAVSRIIVEGITHRLVIDLVEKDQHHDLAHAINNENIDRMVEQDEDGKVFYVDYSGLKWRNQQELDALKKKFESSEIQTNGLIRFVLFVSKDKKEEALKNFGDIDMVSEDYLQNLEITGQETPLKKHAWISFGITNVSLLASRDQAKNLTWLVRSALGAVGVIDDIAGPITLESINTLFDQQKARLAASQA